MSYFWEYKTHLYPLKEKKKETPGIETRTDDLSFDW